MTTENITPSYFGYLKSTADAILLVEGCLQGIIRYAPYEHNDGEIPQLMKSDKKLPPLIESGYIYICKDPFWDGKLWSGSEVVGNFLIFKQLWRRPHLDSSNSGASTEINSTTNKFTQSGIASVVTSPRLNLKESGLRKKTISFTVDSVSYHLISYYNVNDVHENRLPVPSNDLTLQKINIRDELYTQNFRADIHGVDRVC